MRQTHLIKTLIFKVILLALVDHAPGQLVSYEPSWGTFPEAQGWQRTTYCQPVRWVQDGWFLQHVQFAHCVPGEGGEYDRYFYSLDYLTGSSTFFLEWESMSDGPSTEIIYVAPSNITASSQSGSIDNHFTVARDVVRYIRDVDDIPHVYMDITPVPHVYRLEYYNERDPWYVWTIDGIVVDEGLAEGPFPGSNPLFPGVTTFRSTSWTVSSVTRWRYVREGEIPIAGSLDFTNDGLIDHLDYYLFRDYMVLSGPSIPHARGWSVGDADEDADLDLHDFAALQNAFTGDE